MIPTETNITGFRLISERGSTLSGSLSAARPHETTSLVAAVVRNDTKSFSSPRGKFADKSATGAPRRAVSPSARDWLRLAPKCSSAVDGRANADSDSAGVIGRMKP